jgi:hypothetical protein
LIYILDKFDDHISADKTFQGLMSKEEIYTMIFGIEIKEEEYHKDLSVSLSMIL